MKHIFIFLFPDLYSYERREALGAKKAFIEQMGASYEDANLDKDPRTGEYGRNEEKVTMYHDGVPEMIGKKTVEEIFEGDNVKNYFSLSNVA